MTEGAAGSLASRVARWARRAGRTRWVRVAAWAGLALGAGVAALRAAVAVVPFPDEAVRRLPASALLLDRRGDVMRIELGAGGFDCRVNYHPEAEHWVAKAIVAAEDHRFWQHGGLDPLALLRAAGQNVFHLRRISGASTLSTQVIRMAEPRPRIWRTKIIEAFRALQLEARYGKHEILRHYLLRAPFGGNRVGVESAARTYFGKGAADLSLAEASLLAGLPQAPSRLRPDRHPERAKVRQAYVLERMEACGYITAEQRRDALAQPIQIRAEAKPFRAPHFCDMIGVPQSSPEGTVRTTLDAGWQEMAERALSERMSELDATAGAVVVLDVRSGAVRALVGSPDYFAPDAGQVNAAVAARAAGSTLKPFAYALAFDQGIATPATVLADVPIRFRDFKPENFARDYRGLVSVRNALVRSLNLPAIEMQRRTGTDAFLAKLRELGLATINRRAEHYGLGLVLGSAEVRLLDLANAYACLARGGEWKPLRFEEGAPEGAGRRVFSEEAAWLVSDMLSGEERAGDLPGYTSDARLPAMAWKTGTSAGQRDAWTVAWNPDVVVGVWMGHASGAGSDDLVGRVAATPVAWDIFRGLHPDGRGAEFARPAGIVEREVCADSGCYPGRHCAHRALAWSIARVTRSDSCAVHRDGPEPVWPAAVASFMQRQERASEEQTAPAVRIVSPARGGTYRKVPGEDLPWQQLSFEAAAATRGELLYWFVDDRPVGKSRAGQPLYWPLEQGEHQIVCASATGLSDLVKIVVE